MYFKSCKCLIMKFSIFWKYFTVKTDKFWTTLYTYTCNSIKNNLIALFNVLASKFSVLSPALTRVKLIGPYISKSDEYRKPIGYF